MATNTTTEPTRQSEGQMNIHEMLEEQDRAREATAARFTREHDEEHEDPKGGEFDRDDEGATEE